MTDLILEASIKSVMIFFLALGGFAYMTWVERKFIARLQTRYGPNRAGPFGLLQPIADGLKLFFKEELTPAGADKVIFTLAPIITLLPAMLVFAVIPAGGAIHLFGKERHLVLASNVNVGVLYILAVTSIAVYGITLAGWSSNNKYSLLGGLRSSAQMISYELAMGLSILSVVLTAGTLNVEEIVYAQNHPALFRISVWFIFIQPVAFVIYAITAFAEVNRAPFDLPEAEQELTAGYHTEYSGMKFALFFAAEYIKMIAVSALGATLFLGGYGGPFVDQVPLLGPVYFVLKTLLALVVFVWVRGTLPRFRYDKLMAFGWKVLLPLSLANMLVTALVILVLGGK
jgi:NADH-quinone oxidoreductase subunit H